MSDETSQHLELSEVETICRNALSVSGLNPSATAAITDVVTAAERDGCHSHGLFRVPGYCQAVLSGTVSGTVQPEVHDVAGGVVRVDAGGGYAPPAILAGRDLAIQKARESGIACLAIHNSVHYAALWWEVEALAREGMVALAFVNSKSFVAHRPGGTRKLYGTNPMAFGFPRAASNEAGKGPLVWDQASAAMARGEIQLHHRDGHTLPEGVAIDRDGKPITSPKDALVGFCLIDCCDCVNEFFYKRRLEMVLQTTIFVQNSLGFATQSTGRSTVALWWPQGFHDRHDGGAACRGTDGFPVCL